MSTPLPDRLSLPDGLVGLPDVRGLEVRPVDDSALVELVSPDDPELGFLGLPGDAVRPGYHGALVDRRAAGPDDAILLLLSVHGQPPAVTANLAGPLVVGVDGSTRQLVLDDLPLRWPLTEPA